MARRRHSKDQRGQVLSIFIAIWSLYKRPERSRNGIEQRTIFVILIYCQGNLRVFPGSHFSLRDPYKEAILKRSPLTTESIDVGEEVCETSLMRNSNSRQQGGGGGRGVDHIVRNIFANFGFRFMFCQNLEILWQCILFQHMVLEKLQLRVSFELIAFVMIFDDMKIFDTSSSIDSTRRSMLSQELPCWTTYL